MRVAGARVSPASSIRVQDRTRPRARAGTSPTMTMHAPRVRFDSGRQVQAPRGQALRGGRLYRYLQDRFTFNPRIHQPTIRELASGLFAEAETQHLPGRPLGMLEGLIWPRRWVSEHYRNTSSSTIISRVMKGNQITTKSVDRNIADIKFYAIY